jgi:hypothetical protein
MVVIGDESAGRAPAAKKACSMKDRISELLSREAQYLRQQADGMPPGVVRDDLLKKARRADTASQPYYRVSLPGLQSPE